MFSTKPTEFGKLWKASYEKLREHCDGMPDTKWDAALSLAASRYPCRPEEAIEFL